MGGGGHAVSRTHVEGAFCSRCERRYLLWGAFEIERPGGTRPRVRFLDTAPRGPTCSSKTSCYSCSLDFPVGQTDVVLLQLSPPSAHRVYDSALAGCETPNSKRSDWNRICKMQSCAAVSVWMLALGQERCVGGQCAARTPPAGRVGTERLRLLGRATPRLHPLLGWLTSSFYFGSLIFLTLAVRTMLPNSSSLGKLKT